MRINFKQNSVIIISIISLIVLAVIIVLINKLKMGSFQKMILVIAVIILFMSSIVIAYALHKSKNTNWPPMIPDCPDYWVSDGSGNKITCTNVKNLGVCKPPTGSEHLVMNFKNPPYTGANGNCAKYTWANNCKLAWDGLTYGGSNPCVNA
jgi:hypothetical protein